MTRLIASWVGVAVVQSSGHQALRHAHCWFWLSPHAEKDHPTLLVHFRLLSPVGYIPNRPLVASTGERAWFRPEQSSTACTVSHSRDTRTGRGITPSPSPRTQSCRCSYAAGQERCCAARCRIASNRLLNIQQCLSAFTSSSSRSRKPRARWPASEPTPG